MKNLQPFNPDESGPIQQTVEIDDLLLNIAAIDEQIEQYKALKAHRVAAIDVELKKLAELKESSRNAIRSYMSQHGEKALNYPGVAKVIRKPGTRKWNILDEAALIDYLNEVAPEDVKKAVVSEPKIVSKEMNKLLDKLAQSKQLNTEAVKVVAGEESIAITFDKESPLLGERAKDARGTLLDTRTYASIPEQDAAPKDAPPAKETNYDGLEI